MNDIHSIFDFQLDNHSKKTFKAISTWSTVAAASGFITLVLSAYSYVKTLLYVGDITPIHIFIFYAIALALYVIMVFCLNYFLFQFGIKSHKAVVDNDQESLIIGLKHLKMYIRFLGILLILVICFVLLLFMISLVFS